MRSARELTKGLPAKHPLAGLGLDDFVHDPIHPKAPKLAPYAFGGRAIQDLAVAIRLDLNALLVGPTGCGKTSLPIQLAAALGHPCVRFNLDGETRVAQLRGQQRPAAEGGVLTLKFSLGALAEALAGGWWVVLDELDAASPAVLFVLQPVFEEQSRSLYVPETGETIEAAPGFRVFATSNTAGFRSRQRAQHAGTNMMNSALIDRFGAVIAVDYPSREEEINRVKMHVPELVDVPEGVGLTMIDGICRTAETLRKDARFKTDFSTRRCIQWARLVAHFPIEDHVKRKELPFDVVRAAHLAVLRKLESPTDMTVAAEVISRLFGYSIQETTAAT